MQSKESEFIHKELAKEQNEVNKPMSIIIKGLKKYRTIIILEERRKEMRVEIKNKK